MLIGYARISKADGSQSLDLQRDALREAGVSDDAIYEDQASGQREDRPGLAAFLKAARQGDVIVVWRLDRLGRNLRCTSQGQEGRAPSRAEQSAGAASSGSDGAARHEGQRAMPRTRRNQGDDLPLRSARWFLEKPRATGPGSLGGPKSGP